MQKLVKILVMILMVGAFGFILLSPVMVGRAAPPALPSCGNSAISNTPSLASGSPDIAASNEMTPTYTAVVWSGDDTAGSLRGKIMLAYSDVQTTTRVWTQKTIDVVAESVKSQDPNIVFDSTLTDTVHIAYRKYQGVYYRKCKLSECSSSAGGKDITFAANQGKNTTDDLPQVAVMTDTVVIVYQENDLDAGTTYLKYAYIDSGGVLTKNIKVTNNPTSTIKEENPTVVYANGKVHIAYVNRTGSPPQVEYLSLSMGDLGSSVPVEEGFVRSGEIPERPTIDAKSGSVVLAWEIHDSPVENYHSLVYSLSSDNGENWSPTGKYNYLLSDTENFASKYDWDTESSSGGFTFGQLLRPSVAWDGSKIHLAWHARDGVGNRHDILYSRHNVDKWEHGSPTWPITYTANASYTNVTTYYASSEINFYGRASDEVNKVQPRIIYGPPGNRLQMVYMAETAAGGWDIYYNGWQMGSDAPYNFEDTDCDWIPNTVELPPSITCTHTGTRLEEDELWADCDEDYIPNHMDENSDNDFQDDFTEWTKNGTGMYEFSQDGGVFMPVILKSS